jgi:myotubularin-related protein 5/13
MENKTYCSFSRIPPVLPRPPRIVPKGPSVFGSTESQPLVTNSARRLEVLRNCVLYIFESKITEARKVCPAVLRALKSKSARLVLCEELKLRIKAGKVELDHQQFDLITHLMDCALWVSFSSFYLSIIEIWSEFVILILES